MTYLFKPAILSFWVKWRHFMFLEAVVVSPHDSSVTFSKHAITSKVFISKTSWIHLEPKRIKAFDSFLQQWIQDTTKTWPSAKQRLQSRCFSLLYVCFREDKTYVISCFAKEEKLGIKYSFLTKKKPQVHFEVCKCCHQIWLSKLYKICNTPFYAEQKAAIVIKGKYNLL